MNNVIRPLPETTQGMEPLFAEHYIRRIRLQGDDPMFEFLEKMGIDPEAVGIEAVEEIDLFPNGGDPLDD